MLHKEYRGILKIIVPVEFYFSMLLFLRDAKALLCPFVSFYLPHCAQRSACSCAEAERRGSSYAILYQPAPKSIYLEGWLFRPVYGSTQVSAPLPHSSPLPARNTPRRKQVFLQPSSAVCVCCVISPDDRDTKSPCGIVLNLLHPNRDSHPSTFPSFPGKPCGSTGSCFESILFTIKEQNCIVAQNQATRAKTLSKDILAAPQL